MKTTFLRNTLLYPACLAVGAVALVSAIPNAAHATQTVRELWDGPNSKFALDGAWGDGVSSLGFDPGTNWVTSPAGNTSFRYDGSWNLDWQIGDNDTLLPYSVGHGGTLAYYGTEGNMGSTLINPATGLAYGDYYSQCYATRALATSSYIDFNADGTYYFSVRFIGGGGYDWWSGDFAGGVGLASSGETNAHFAGAGWTRNSYLAEDGVTDIGKSAYITAGTLDQAGIAGHPDDSGGPYYARTNGPAQALASGSYGTGALLVGQLITTSGGAATMNVKLFFPYAGVPSDPGTITWDATYSFTETSVMTRLLLWQYGTGPSVQDAIRVGTAYGDVIGLEIVGAPNASPGKTVYAGTPVTFSSTYAGLNTGIYPMTYQWLSNGVPITDATSATLVLTDPTTSSTADYSLAAANSFGTITSAVTHLTVNPAVGVFITKQPVPTTRYLGAPSATFTVAVDGTPPYAYQWHHAGTNIQSATVTSDMTNVLTIAPVPAADAGDYSVTITNLFGSTNSDVVTLTVTVPAPGSYAAAVTALSPYGYWRLNDNGSTNDPTLYDYWGWNNGQALDAANTANTIFGVPGMDGPGFPAPHLATSIGDQFWTSPYRLNLPNLPIYTTTMTFTMWVKGGCELMARNGYGNAYGLELNGGNLQFDWGGITAWNSGLQVPANTWAFVALVVQPDQAAIYVGNKASLNSAVDSGLSLSDSTTLGDTPYLTPLCIGRNPLPWAEGGGGSQWASTPGIWSDVSIFYQALTPEQITSLFLAGAGVWIEGTPDGAGNLTLNWVPGGTLQEANSVTGPYTDVSGSPTPPYSVPISTATTQHYYRVKR
jgi:hypothetical protein